VPETEAKLPSSVLVANNDEKMEIIDGMPALIIQAAQSTPAGGDKSIAVSDRPQAPSVPIANGLNEGKVGTIKEESASQSADDLNKRLKLGFAALSNKNWQGADYIYGEIIKINENNAQAWLGLGLARFKLNDKDYALKAFQKAVALAPHDVAAQAAVQFATETKVQTGYLAGTGTENTVKPVSQTAPAKTDHSSRPPDGKIGIGAHSDSL
jgi:tetratricopeptide (TPR) repeat protein